MAASAVRCAFIGLGTLGTPMAHNIAKVMPVSAFNRTTSKAEAFVKAAGANASLATTVDAAVEQADIVVTILGDAASVEQAMPASALATMGKRGAVWLQMSTVGIEGCDRLHAIAKQHGITFVDAPVAGTKKPAEDGMLKVLVGCNASEREKIEKLCTPLFDAIGQKTVWVGDIGRASRLKLVINSWVVGLLGLLSETMALASRLEIDPNMFLNGIKGGPLDVGYAHIKAAQMMAREYPASFPLEQAMKDTRLILAAGNTRPDAELRVFEAVLAQFQKADAKGHGRADMAAIYESVV